jgi:hypothetical protein
MDAKTFWRLGTIHYLWLGVGWQKKGVGHEVFLTEKGGGAPKYISLEGGGPVIYYSGEKFDMFCRFVGLPCRVRVKFDTSCLAVFVVHWRSTLYPNPIPNPGG